MNLFTHKLHDKIGQLYAFETIRHTVLYVQYSSTVAYVEYVPIKTWHGSQVFSVTF